MKVRIAIRKDAFQQEIEAKEVTQSKHLALHSTPFMGTSSGTGLPKIKLQRFSGDFKRWGSFNQLLTDISIDNVLLKNSQRTHYLKFFTKDKARELVGNMLLTEESFNQLRTFYRAASPIHAA